MVGAQVRALNVAGGRIVWCNKLPSLMLFREELYCLFNSLPGQTSLEVVSFCAVYFDIPILTFASDQVFESKS